MSFKPLPRQVKRVIVPPIKCQGIKTKLVPFILSNVKWDGRGRWIEPFLGSGVVLFNVQPERALVSDSNIHIITLYKRIADGSLTPERVEAYLKREGAKLLSGGAEYYYEVRKRFNTSHDPLDFLFLSRACFNGVMRFNKKGEFNVPFCNKPDRFRQAYVTKITNQVLALARVMRGKEWEFRSCDWRECLAEAREGDFVYLDPPYIGRHVDYYNHWTEEDAIELAKVAQSLPCGVALSMWKENKYRANGHLSDHWSGMVERTFSHYYHVGSLETLRNSMEEALMITPGYEAVIQDEQAADQLQWL